MIFHRVVGKWEEGEDEDEEEEERDREEEGEEEEKKKEREEEDSWLSKFSHSYVCSVLYLLHGFCASQSHRPVPLSLNYVLLNLTTPFLSVSRSLLSQSHRPVPLNLTFPFLPLSLPHPSYYHHLVPLSLTFPSFSILRSCPSQSDRPVPLCLTADKFLISTHDLRISTARNLGVYTTKSEHLQSRPPDKYRKKLRCIYNQIRTPPVTTSG
ncbi:hypothetical protein PoB_002379000 [Plakobranchus ocellatus]|uniref:Nucleolar protein 10 n=1 Tax=Plakobranchus ocellatus TaxID=259542 RepID=A0AAV3ZRR1_9GAST|nr:hypothetical protein PoB_002379000 [Plakobranchus ocellatus]